MPGLNGAWRSIWQFISRANTSATSSALDRNTDRPGALNRRNDVPQANGSSRLHGFYEQVREQVFETQRNNELLRQEQIRRDRRAKRRALSLMMRLLTPEQRQEFRKSGYFHVIGGSSGNRYRIRAATFANIDVVCASGTVMYRLCAHPAGDVPVYDVMAAQMLHLQDPATEKRFLKQANVHPAISEGGIRSSSAWLT
jgi:hypothetical protein